MSGVYELVLRKTNPHPVGTLWAPAEAVDPEPNACLAGVTLTFFITFLWNGIRWLIRNEPGRWKTDLASYATCPGRLNVSM